MFVVGVLPEFLALGFRKEIRLKDVIADEVADERQDDYQRGRGCYQ